MKVWFLLHVSGVDLKPESIFNLPFIAITFFNYSGTAQSKLIIGTSVIVLRIFVFQDAVGNIVAFTNLNHGFKPE